MVSGDERDRGEATVGDGRGETKAGDARDETRVAGGRDETRAADGRDETSVGCTRVACGKDVELESDSEIGARL